MILNLILWHSSEEGSPRPTTPCSWMKVRGGMVEIHESETTAGKRLMVDAAISHLLLPRRLWYELGNCGNLWEISITKRVGVLSMNRLTFVYDAFLFIELGRFLLLRFQLKNVRMLDFPWY